MNGSKVEQSSPEIVGDYCKVSYPRIESMRPGPSSEMEISTDVFHGGLATSVRHSVDNTGDRPRIQSKDTEVNQFETGADCPKDANGRNFGHSFRSEFPSSTEV